MAENPYLKAKTVEEIRAMEKALYEECYGADGEQYEGSNEYYESQMELFEAAFATLFPDEYDYHKRGREQTGKN